MGASGLVWTLVLVGYNSINHQVTTHDIESYHLSPSDCVQEKTYQNKRGRKETFNRKYMCMPVQDYEMRAKLQSAHGQVDGNGYRSGGRIVIEIR